MKVMTLDEAKKLLGESAYVGLLEVIWTYEFGLVGHPSGRISTEPFMIKVVPNNYEYDHGNGD